MRQLYIILLPLIALSCVSSQLRNLDFEEQLRLDELIQNTRQDPRDFDAHLELGVLYTKATMYTEASEALESARNLRPEDPLVLFYLGLNYEMAGNVEAALDVYYNYRTYPVDSPHRRWIHGRYLLVERRKARQELQKMLVEYGENEPLTTINNTVVVLPLVYHGSDNKYASYRQGLTELIIRDLQLFDQLFIADRFRVTTLLKEMEAKGMDIEDRGAIALIGNIFNARTVMRGAYNVLKSSDMVFDISYWDLLEQTIPNSETHSDKTANLFRLQDKLVYSLLKQLKISVTPAIAKKIEAIPTRNMNALLAYSAGIQRLDQGRYKEAILFLEKAIELDPNFTASKQKLIEGEALQTTLGEPYRFMEYRQDNPGASAVNLN